MKKMREIIFQWAEKRELCENVQDLREMRETWQVWKCWRFELLIYTYSIYDCIAVLTADCTAATSGGDARSLQQVCSRHLVVRFCSAVPVLCFYSG